MGKHTAPSYVLDNFKITTQRQWRITKRAELKKAIAIIDELRCGSAYTPNGKDGEMVGLADDILMALKEAWSPKNWGR